MALNEDSYYGIHTQRAAKNFNTAGRPVNPSLIHGVLLVKKASALANMDAKLLDRTIGDAIVLACDRLLAGEAADQFITDALQGGAGTSTNMNANEVIANLALEILGKEKGAYTTIHPIGHVNLSQSTNDVYPTALRIAAIFKVRTLADSLAALQESLQEKEKAFSHVLKLGRTQLMDALPVTLGQEFGAYARAISRDRWRIYKAEERLREINMGGTAVGTGLNAPKAYTYRVTDYLQKLTGLGLARSDYLMDTTQNMDVFTEVSGILKACATNLIKIAGDIRLMASGPQGGFGELKLEPVQAGSSIMPGKVNPVICETTIQAAIRTIAHDTAITQAAAMGTLELNPFAPLIADSLLDALDVLNSATITFDQRCIQSLEADEARCLSHVENASSLAAVFIHHFGYDKSADMAKGAMAEGLSLKAFVLKEGLMDETTLNTLLNVHQITGPGIPGQK